MSTHKSAHTPSIKETKYECWHSLAWISCWAYAKETTRPSLSGAIKKCRHACLHFLFPSGKPCTVVPLLRTSRRVMPLKKTFIRYQASFDHLKVCPKPFLFSSPKHLYFFLYLTCLTIFLKTFCEIFWKYPFTKTYCGSLDQGTTYQWLKKKCQKVVSLGWSFDFNSPKTWCWS